MVALAVLSSVPTMALAQGEGRNHGPGYQFWPRTGGHWHGGSHWNGGGHWRGDWNGRHGAHWGRWHGHYRHGWRHGGWWGWGSAIGLGIGIPLGYALNDGYYGEPIYRPRYYPSAGSAHVRWCYNRYRSYRAWDNTFQPYNGPRQQCISPYG
jgi:hypothetical protein